jgi:hypothetical protein
VAATCAIEFENDQPVHRSKFLITVRKGIRYPEDVWASNKTGKPLTSTHDIKNSRFIFQSRMPNGSSWDVFVSDFDGQNMVNLTAKDVVSYDGICNGEGDVVAEWLNEREIRYCSIGGEMKVNADPLFGINKR